MDWGWADEIIWDMKNKMALCKECDVCDEDVFIYLLGVVLNL